MTNYPFFCGKSWERASDDLDMSEILLLFCMTPGAAVILLSFRLISIMWSRPIDVERQRGNLNLNTQIIKLLSLLPSFFSVCV